MRDDMNCLMQYQCNHHAFSEMNSFPQWASSVKKTMAVNGQAKAGVAILIVNGQHQVFPCKMTGDVPHV